MEKREKLKKTMSSPHGLGTKLLKNCTRAIFLGSLVLACSAIAQSSLDSPLETLKQLRETPISRFEWGLERYRVALIEHFRVDPLSLEPSVPPFFINVVFDEEKAEILVEIGRTFGSVQENRARQFCENYLIQARSMLAVDRLGNPVVKDTSSLAADFFQASSAGEDPPISIAKALDQLVMLRALVVAPASGIYSVCGAKLIGMPIKHLE